VIWCIGLGLFLALAHVAGWWLTYPSEKYEFVNGKDDIPYMKWTIKAMFETTNQNCSDLPLEIEKKGAHWMSSSC